MARIPNRLRTESSKLSVLRMNLELEEAKTGRNRNQNKINKIRGDIARQESIVRDLGGAI